MQTLKVSSRGPTDKFMRKRPFLGYPREPTLLILQGNGLSTTDLIALIGN